MKPVKVSQLNNYIKRILISDPILTGVAVIGEISNIKYHGSGHVYFTLKDESSTIKCFLSSEMLKKLRYELEDGMEITATGYVSVYERGGYYSLNINSIEVSGVGNLAYAYQLLKEKLERNGIFDRKHKKKIPFFPEKIAIVTSETGAAIRDILRTIEKRNRHVDILIYPVLVQGEGAAEDISQAINDINISFPEIDAMIVGRGGGSIEDLWAFNEEKVAMAIFNSKIPIISAVGHETDITIADFVADVRAETPTAAANIIVPDIAELKDTLLNTKDMMAYYMKKNIERNENLLENYSKEALSNILKSHIDVLKMKIEFCHNQLTALAPDNIMDRGYCAISNQEGNVISSVTQIGIGESINIILRDGQIIATVQERRF